MSKEIVLSPIENRERIYEELFDGELAFPPLKESADIGVAGLARNTHRRIKHLRLEDEHLRSIPRIVDSTLLEHERKAREEDNSDKAIFSFIDISKRHTFPIVGEIVAEVFTQWELALKRNNRDRLLRPNSEEAKLMVIETAAAVMAVNGPIGPFNIEKHQFDRTTLKLILGSWGPGFIRGWFDDSIIKKWAMHEEMSEEDTEQLLEVLTPNKRKRLLSGYSHDPFIPLGHIKHNILEVLTIENIARHFQWSPEEAKKNFSKGAINWFAIYYPLNPLEGCRKWVSGEIQGPSPLHRNRINSTAREEIAA